MSKFPLDEISVEDLLLDIEGSVIHYDRIFPECDISIGRAAQIILDALTYEIDLRIRRSNFGGGEHQTDIAKTYIAKDSIRPSIWYYTPNSPHTPMRVVR